MAEAVLDDREARKYLQKLIKKAQNVEKENETVGLISAVTFQDIMDHFKKQEGPAGAWPKWSRSHKKRAAQLGFSESSNMLKWTGRLRNSVTPNAKVVKEGLMWFNAAKTSPSKSKKKTQKKQASKNKKVELKKRSGRPAARKPFPYAWWHDSSENPKQRSFMWLSKSALDKIADIVLNEIIKE